MLTKYFNEGVHLAIARQVIKSIAFGGKTVTDKTGHTKFIQFRSANACYELWKNSFKDTLVQDIEQSIALEMINLTHEGLLIEDYPCYYDEDISCYIVNKKKLVFLDYVEGEKVKNAYSRLYKATIACLASYSQNNGEKSQLYINDLVYMDDNGDMHALSNKASNYLIEASKQADICLHDLVNNQDIVDFMEYYKSVTKQEIYKRACKIISGLVHGMKQTEIADFFGFSLNQIRYTIDDIRDKFNSNGFAIHLNRTFNRAFGKGVEGTITTYQEGKQELKNPVLVDFSKCRKAFTVNSNHKDLFNYESEKPIHKITDYRTNTKEKGFVDDKLKELGKAIKKTGKTGNFYKSDKLISRYNENDSCYEVLKEYYNPNEKKFYYF